MKVAEVEGGYWTVCMRLFEESSALEALYGPTIGACHYCDG